MRVILIDDEPMALENFRYVIRQCEGVEILGAFTDPFEALRSLQCKPVLCLDINASDYYGIEEIYSLPDVYFCSGYNHCCVALRLML